MGNQLSNLRHRAFVAQGGHCYYCGRPMWEHDPKKFAASRGMRERAARQFKCTAEHLLARQDGGRDVAGNVVAACHFCNCHRHARRADRASNPETYRTHVQRRVAAGRWCWAGAT